MSMDELHTLATQINAEQSDDQITLIYNIIDKESEVGSMDASTEVKPKKRGRKSKAEKEAEANGDKADEGVIPATPVTPSTVEDTPQPKKRGRKAKAEKEAVEVQTEDTSQKEEVTENTPAEKTAQPKKRGRKSKAEKETIENTPQASDSKEKEKEKENDRYSKVHR